MNILTFNFPTHNTNNNLNNTNNVIEIHDSIIYLSNGSNYLQYTINNILYDMSDNIILSDCSLNLIEDITITNNYFFFVRNNVYFNGNHNTITFDNSEFDGLFNMSDVSNGNIMISNLIIECYKNVFTLFGAFLIQSFSLGNIYIYNCRFNGTIIGSYLSSNSAFIALGAGNNGYCYIEIDNCHIQDISGSGYATGNCGYVGSNAGTNYGHSFIKITNSTGGNVYGNLTNNSIFV